MRDPSKFLLTFESWKNGNNYWDARGISAPGYEEGKDDYLYTYSGTKHIDPSSDGKRVDYEVTIPETLVTADYPYYSSNNPNYRSSFDPNGAENFLDATGVGTIYNPFRYTREISNFLSNPKLAIVGALESSIPFSAPGRALYGAYLLASDNGIKKTANLISNGEYGNAALSGAGDLLNAAMSSPIATNSYRIARNLTPEMRRLNLYISKGPYSYSGVGSTLKTYANNILTKNKSQMLLESENPDWDYPDAWKSVHREYGVDYDVGRKARIDAYRLYNLMPLKYNTFEKSPSYLNTYTAKKDIENLSEFPKFISQEVGNKSSGVFTDFINGSGGGVGYRVSNTGYGTPDKYGLNKMFGLLTTKDIWDVNPFERASSSIFKTFPELNKPFTSYNRLKNNISSKFRNIGESLSINSKEYNDYINEYKSKYGLKKFNEMYDYGMFPSPIDFKNKGLKLKVGTKLLELANKIKPEKQYYENKIYKGIDNYFKKFEVGDFTTSKPFNVVNEIPFTDYPTFSDKTGIVHNIVKGIDTNDILPSNILDMVKNKNLSTNMNINPLYKDGKDMLPGFNIGTNGTKIRRPRVLSELYVYKRLKNYGVTNPYVAAAITANAGIESEYNSDSVQASGAHKGLWLLQPGYVDYVVKHYGGYGPEQLIKFAADIANGTLPETKSTVGRWLNTGVSKKFRSQLYKTAADASTGFQRYFEGAMGQKDKARRDVAERIYKLYLWDENMNTLNKMIQLNSIQPADNTRVATPAISKPIFNISTPLISPIMLNPILTQSIYPTQYPQQYVPSIMLLPPVTQTMYNLYNDLPLLQIPQFDNADGFARGKDKGIHIAKSKEGTFTRAAKRHGMGVQAFANKVLSAPKGKYSSAMRKKANFAKQSAKWNH